MADMADMADRPAMSASLAMKASKPRVTYTQPLGNANALIFGLSNTLKIHCRLARRDCAASRWPDLVQVGLKHGVFDHAVLA
jgi:hypothetical protein